GVRAAAIHRDQDRAPAPAERAHRPSVARAPRQRAGAHGHADRRPHLVPEAGMAALVTRIRAQAVILTAGVLLRLAVLASVVHRPLNSDSVAFIVLARRFSFLRPWRASVREPLWIASVKVVTGPFGYSGFALRVFTTGLSIVALFVVWLVVQKLLFRTAALVAIAFLAFNFGEVFEAVRGLREE